VVTGTSFIFHFIEKGCHPKPIDFHSIIFQDGQPAPPDDMISHGSEFFQSPTRRDDWDDLRCTTYVYLFTKQPAAQGSAG